MSHEKRIEFNATGRILEGAYKGWYIIVEHDVANTGGFFIYISDSPNVKGSTEIDDGGTGFDEWFKTQKDVESHFERSAWTISWK